MIKNKQKNVVWQKQWDDGTEDQTYYRIHKDVKIKTIKGEIEEKRGS